MAVVANVYVMEKPGTPLVRQKRTFGSPGRGEAIVEVIGCGLCHTDLGFAKGDVPTRMKGPIILGHEVVGRVVEVGAGSTRRPGELVLVPAVLPCGICAFCRAGRGNACPNQKMPGNDIDGGFATHLTVPVWPLVPLTGLPPGFDVWKLGVVADAVSTAWQAVRRSGLAAGDLAVVIGTGGVGGFTAQIAHALGAVVVAMDVKKPRVDLAARYGADHTFVVEEGNTKALRSSLRDLAKLRDIPSFRLRLFEASGTSAGQLLAFGLLDRGATYVQVGYTPEQVEVRLSNLMAFDASLHGTWGCPVGEYPAVLDLIAKGRIVLDPFVELAPLSRVNEYLTAMDAGHLERRLVLDSTR